jgi:hypothetical protein
MVDDPGAQVMLIKNLSSELVNGSRGVVVGWAHQGYTPLRFANNDNNNDNNNNNNNTFLFSF